MKIQRLSPHAYQFTRFRLFNSYLVRESDSFTLIDTMLPGSAKPILTAANAIGPQPMTRVLLTHAHGDHVGSVDALSAALGNPDVAITAREARLMLKKRAQDRSLDPGEPQCKVKGGFPGTVTRPTHTVADGELFGSLRVLTTPGHTPGHASYFDERDGTLYAGDSLICVGGKVHVPGFGPWYFPLPSLATWHRPTALASARKMLEFLGDDIRRYASGHGRLVTGGPELLDHAVNTAERKLR